MKDKSNHNCVISLAPADYGFARSAFSPVVILVINVAPAAI
ncbi:hypothetical protein [Legionella jordanis]|nr:hypothetical protein [Legionella jordanis]